MSGIKETETESELTGIQRDGLKFAVRKSGSMLKFIKK